ncbi:hypothetical protein DL766_005104 [Monosporascus sp. MC13-8B]|uniref:C2H2-type domain-containing protein n=1 Tax=Monosporascus cannonballus TaxID=155416 RepID=A0ABY0HC41_9PEZI|nr:hypothetical protein DL762_002945 [Monosporascus cannonballus]RYO97257.1 hypothetical protein DL763_002806 [Monosporascus cannonballus]RYP29958.1 hypothetical protein DL766_005104 [Monosporascus sp. MC13-8B]
MSYSFDAASFGEGAEGYNDYSGSTPRSAHHPYPARPLLGPTTPYPRETFLLDQPCAYTNQANVGSPAAGPTYGTYRSDLNWSNSFWPLPQGDPGELGCSGFTDTLYSGENYYQPGSPRFEGHVDLEYTSHDQSPNSPSYGDPAANPVQATPGLAELQGLPINEAVILPETSVPEEEAAPSFACRYCGKTHRDTKSRDRHEMEVHEKPKAGANRRGWYRCKCGKRFCYFRKANYTRHRGKCRGRKRTMATYHCQCGVEHADDSAHEMHYRGCNDGRRPVGRPPHSPHSGATEEMQSAEEWGV